MSRPNVDPPYRTQQERIATLERELADCRSRLPFAEGVVTWEPPAKMNVANTEALEKLVEEAHTQGIPRYLLPLWLTLRGCLVPSALTNEQAHAAAVNATTYTADGDRVTYTINADDFRAYLARIAREGA
jgi:hypothetical protein